MGALGWWITVLRRPAAQCLEVGWQQSLRKRSSALPRKRSPDQRAFQSYGWGVCAVILLREVPSILFLKFPLRAAKATSFLHLASACLDLSYLQEKKWGRRKKWEEFKANFSWKPKEWGGSRSPEHPVKYFLPYSHSIVWTLTKQKKKKFALYT